MCDKDAHISESTPNEESQAIRKRERYKYNLLL